MSEFGEETLLDQSENFSAFFLVFYSNNIALRLNTAIIKIKFQLQSVSEFSKCYHRNSYFVITAIFVNFIT